MSDLDVAVLSQQIESLNRIGKKTDAAGTGSVFARLAQIAAFVDTLETVLGTNADAAGTSTVFARLAQIAGFTDQVEGYTDTLETKLGDNTDVSGTSTIFAHLARIYAAISGGSSVDLSPVTSKTNLIGATSDVAGTTTIFARLAQIAGYTDQVEAFVDTLETVLGTSADALSASTIFGKLKNVEAFATRLGANTDTAGTSTAFARLAQIVDYVDTLEANLGTTGDVANGTGTALARLAQIIQYVDTLETTEAAVKAKTDLIGAAADAAGTTTIFARLAQIAGYVDTLETTDAAIKAKTDLVGATADAAGTSTIFARLAQIAGFTDALETTIGTTSDVANPTGTAMARLKQVVDNLPDKAPANLEYLPFPNKLYTIANEFSGGVFWTIANDVLIKFNYNSGGDSATLFDLNGNQLYAVTAGSGYRYLTQVFAVDSDTILFFFRNTTTYQIYAYRKSTNTGKLAGNITFTNIDICGLAYGNGRIFVLFSSASYQQATNVTSFLFDLPTMTATAEISTYARTICGIGVIGTKVYVLVPGTLYELNNPNATALGTFFNNLTGFSRSLSVPTINTAMHNPRSYSVSTDKLVLVTQGGNMPVVVDTTAWAVINPGALGTFQFQYYGATSNPDAANVVINSQRINAVLKLSNNSMGGSGTMKARIAFTKVKDDGTAVAREYAMPSANQLPDGLSYTLWASTIELVNGRYFVKFFGYASPYGNAVQYPYFMREDIHDMITEVSAA